MTEIQIKNFSLSHIDQTNPTWGSLGSNPGLYAEMLTNNCLCQGTTLLQTHTELSHKKKTLFMNIQYFTHNPT
jgi:hypothetical protein